METDVIQRYEQAKAAALREKSYEAELLTSLEKMVTWAETYARNINNRAKQERIQLSEDGPLLTDIRETQELIKKAKQ